MSVDPRNIRYADVRDKLHRELEDARTALETATGGDVLRLQGHISALRSVIDWFERGALAERALFDSNPRSEA